MSIGGQAPSRANLATVLLIDLIVNHCDDWFTFAVPARPGEVLTLETVNVLDSFGQSWPLSPPAGWGLFQTEGLGPCSLVVWATTATPLLGPMLDEVVIGIDEDAKLVWAVERVVRGRTMPMPSSPSLPAVQGDPDTRRTFSYQAMTPVAILAPVRARRPCHQPLRPGRAADLSGPKAALLPPPISDLLYDAKRRPGDPVHQLDSAAIPSDGVRIERRAVLARATTGNPVLWTQRRRQPLVAPPTFALRFDSLEPDYGPELQG